MLGTAQRHFVEEALGTHQETLFDWFPGCFHWAGLCKDAPSMAARITGDPDHADDVGLDHAISERAERVFAFAHVATLAVLATAGIHDGDPGETLERLVELPEDEEEEYFAALVAEVLGPLERTLAGEDAPRLDDRGEVAYGLLDAAWPSVESLLEEDGVLGEREQEVPGADTAHQEAVRSVLSSIALVAAVLATFRWMSVGQSGDAQAD